MNYRPEIDGLRAVAVLAVIAHHAGAPLAGGFLGVDIFFVISGYLITAILLTEMRDDRFSLGGFYLRRARRLLPALILVVAVSCPVAWILMAPEQMELFGQGLVALSIFGTNGLYWWKSGYFSPEAAENPLIHTWSLAVEEQFYLVFPVALLWLWRRDQVFVGLAIALIAGLALAELAARTSPSAAFYLLPFRVWELVAGALTAALVTRYGLPAGGHTAAQTPFRLWVWLKRWRGPLSSLGVGLIVASLLFYRDWMAVPGLWAAIPVVGSVLVILCAGPGSRAHWLLSARPVVAIGLISYSAYLWHQPVFAFARLSQLDEPEPGHMMALTLLVLGLAWATWAAVEIPFRRRIGLRPLIALTGVSGLAAGAIGLTVHFGNGLGSLRYGPEKMAVFESAEASPVRKRCHGMPERFAPETACVLAGDTPAWAVLGDSHGVELSYALAQKISDERHGDQGVVQLTASGCPPALGFETDVPGCAAWIEAAVTWLEAHPELPVLVTYRHNSYLFGKNEGLYPELPDAPIRISGPGDSDAKRARYWRSFSEVISRLRAGGRRVVILAPVPEIARPISRYVRLMNLDAAGDLVTIPASYHASRSGWVKERMVGLGTEMLDPAAEICDRAVCFGVREGRALYFDDDHLSLTGAAKVLEALRVDRHQIQVNSKLNAAPPIQNPSAAAHKAKPFTAAIHATTIAMP